MSEIIKANKPWFALLRLIIGLCGLLVFVKFVAPIPTGELYLVLGENDLPDLSFTYVANTPEALLAALVGFGSLSIGFVFFALSPVSALRGEWIVPWGLVVAVALAMLKHLSVFSGIVTAG